jgi:formylglycine-generating enzyme required for sulfatase activity
LSGNAGLPWSHALYEHFADRWNIAAVASHYNGNVRSLTPEQVDRLMRPLADLGIPADAWASIPGGEFLMGSPEGEEGRRDDERPHRVRVAAFQMLKTPVTFAMFDAFCAATGRESPRDQGWGRADRPVINVSYWDAVDYANWLSERTGQICRLPTEAEWEYACRAGTTTPFWTGETLTTEQANYDGESAYGSGPKGVYRDQTTPVRLFPPNPWGLHDMHGNVCEWCASAYDADYTGREWHDASRDRTNDGPRSLRGGAWNIGPAWVRSAYRTRSAPTYRYNVTGFRLARSL